MKEIRRRFRVRGKKMVSTIRVEFEPILLLGVVEIWLIVRVSHGVKSVDWEWGEREGAKEEPSCWLDVICFYRERARES